MPTERLEPDFILGMTFVPRRLLVVCDYRETVARPYLFLCVVFGSTDLLCDLDNLRPFEIGT